MGTALPPHVGPGDPWRRAGGVSPGRDVGGEGGALVGVHELGGPRDVFPLGLVCPSCDSSRKGLGDRLQKPTRDVHTRPWPREHTYPSAPPLAAALLRGQRALRGQGSSTRTQLLVPLRSPSLPSSVSSRLPRCRGRSCCPEGGAGRGHRSPMTLQSSRRLVVSPSPLSRGLSVQEGGSGTRSPMGRWNLRRLGSTVTMGLNVAWLPRSLVTSSSGTGWACEVPRGHTQPRSSRGAHGRRKRAAVQAGAKAPGAGGGGRVPLLLTASPALLSEPPSPSPCCSPLPGALLCFRHLSRKPSGFPSH